MVADRATDARLCRLAEYHIRVSIDRSKGHAALLTRAQASAAREAYLNDAIECYRRELGSPASYAAIAVGIFDAELRSFSRPAGSPEFAAPRDRSPAAVGPAQGA
jgi:hypothetical protein